MFLGDVTAFTRIGLQIEQTRARLIAAIASLLGFGTEQSDERALGLLALAGRADAGDEFPTGVANRKQVTLRA